MTDFDEHSKGSGFVSFSSPDEASRALAEMNMKMVGRKPLYVAWAKRKEERSAKLQAHFSHQLLNPIGNGGNNVFNQFVSTSLYVGDLEPNVTQSQIFDLFERTGCVLSVCICEDVNTNHSLGYAYVNYSSIESASRALDELNFTPLNGKPIRIMYSNFDSSIRESGLANIFIKNLDKAIHSKALYETFYVFETILSCKIATDDASGLSKGYGFVQSEQDEAARNAIEKMNSKRINEK